MCWFLKIPRYDQPLTPNHMTCYYFRRPNISEFPEIKFEIHQSCQIMCHESVIYFDPVIHNPQIQVHVMFSWHFGLHKNCITV